MKVGDRIAVYGTLRPNGGNGKLMKSGATHIGQDRISGELYALGWFPGVKKVTEEFISEGPTVVVDLFEITDDRLPDELDCYEGYPSLYDRKQVITEKGERAWVYTYNGKVSEESLIPSGNWEG